LLCPTPLRIATLRLTTPGVRSLCFTPPHRTPLCVKPRMGFAMLRMSTNSKHLQAPVSARRMKIHR
jgi:hypothetical protein